LFWNQGVESVTSFLILVGCRARIRTWAKGFKVLCATTTQPGTLSCFGAEGRIRTDTGVAPQQFLRLPRLPFRHFGALTREALTPFKHSRDLPFARRRSTANLVPLYSLIVGAEERNRTADTRIFSPLLYRLSYLGIRDIVGFPPF
jgi:hypothetical protein